MGFAGAQGQLASCGPSGRAAGSVAGRLRVAVPRAGRPAVAGAAPRVACGRPCRVRARGCLACNSDELADGFQATRNAGCFCMDAGRTSYAGLIPRRARGYGKRACGVSETVHMSVTCEYAAGVPVQRAWPRR